jgi:antirestriction protein
MTQLTTTKNQVSIYVGTYSKYNNGSIAGAWIDLTDLTEEEFLSTINELHKDEEDPEFMFQDFEANGILKEFISESGIDSEFWEMKETLKELSEEQIEAFEIFINNGHPADIYKFQDAYRGYCNEYNIEQAFGEAMVEELGYLDQVPEQMKYYFDYHKFGRDLLMTDFWEQDGYIFFNNY